MDQVIIGHILGPSGGLFAFGFITGCLLGWKVSVKYFYTPKIDALIKKIDELESKLEPYMAFEHRLVSETLEAKRRAN